MDDHRDCPPLPQRQPCPSCPSSCHPPAFPDITGYERCGTQALRDESSYLLTTPGFIRRPGADSVRPRASHGRVDLVRVNADAILAMTIVVRGKPGRKYNAGRVYRLFAPAFRAPCRDPSKTAENDAHSLHREGIPFWRESFVPRALPLRSSRSRRRGNKTAHDAAEHLSRQVYHPRNAIERMEMTWI